MNMKEYINHATWASDKLNESLGLPRASSLKKESLGLPKASSLKKEALELPSAPKQPSYAEVLKAVENITTLYIKDAIKHNQSSAWIILDIPKMKECKASAEIYKKANYHDQIKAMETVEAELKKLGYDVDLNNDCDGSGNPEGRSSDFEGGYVSW